ncbi:GspMb/PilO family protein [Vogesella facilis]|uniref:GspMb/PilO family protein n=1 Tax=Vogesella facilis TaxID=1655232 RepID=A0ABV7RBN1_9NEIS
MSAARWRYLLAQTDRAVWLLLLVLLGCALFYLAVSRPLQAQLTATQQQIQSQRQVLARLRYQHAHPVASPQLRLGQFYRSFPAQGEAELWLQKVYAAADAQQLLLPRGDYKLQPQPGSQLLRYEITLPLRGSYRQLRQFLTQVRQDNPALLLDDLRFKRDNIGQEQLEASLHLAMLMRGK